MPTPRFSGLIRKVVPGRAWIPWFLGARSLIYLVETMESSSATRCGPLQAGTVVLFLAVALGAFGAHALKERLEPAAVLWWATGVQYQAWHGLALLALGLRTATVPAARRAFPAFVVGILLFSGSLYAMALGGPRILGAVTPLGGLGMLLGWALWAWAEWRLPPSRP